MMINFEISRFVMCVMLISRSDITLRETENSLNRIINFIHIAKAFISSVNKAISFIYFYDYIHCWIGFIISILLWYTDQYICQVEMCRNGYILVIIWPIDYVTCTLVTFSLSVYTFWKVLIWADVLVQLLSS